MGKWLDRFSRITIVGIMGVILLYLSALSIHSTCYTYDEVRHYVTDYPVKHLLLYCIIVLLFVSMRLWIIPNIEKVSFGKN